MCVCVVLADMAVHFGLYYMNMEATRNLLLGKGSI